VPLLRLTFNGSIGSGTEKRRRKREGQEEEGQEEEALVE
jgi:hypothetical protein